MKRKESENTTPIQTSRFFDLLGGVDTFLSLNNNQRISLLGEFEKKAHTSEMPGNRQLSRTILDNNLGMLVIKPEAFAGKSKAINFLRETYGITPLIVKDFTYTLEKYLSIYLKVFETYPDSFTDILVPLLLLNTTQSSSVIVFQHQQDYREVYRKLFGTDPKRWLSSSKPDFISDFKRIVVGSGFEPAPHSIRKELELLIENDGYYTFTGGVALAINIESRLQLRPTRSNQITFNGAHSPESGQALIACFNTIFEAKETKDIVSRIID